MKNEAQSAEVYECTRKDLDPNRVRPLDGPLNSPHTVPRVDAFSLDGVTSIRLEKGPGESAAKVANAASR